MPSYNYILPAAGVATWDAIGLASMRRATDPLDPNGDSVVGPLTPGGFASAVMDRATLPVIVSLDQPAAVVSVEDATNGSVTLTVEAPVPFGGV